MRPLIFLLTPLLPIPSAHLPHTFKQLFPPTLFAIKRFRTVCKIPGIGYPPLANRQRSTSSSTSPKPLPSFNSFLSNSFRTLLHNGRPQPFSFQSIPDSFH